MLFTSNGVDWTGINTDFTELNMAERTNVTNELSDFIVSINANKSSGTDIQLNDDYSLAVSYDSGNKSFEFKLVNISPDSDIDVENAIDYDTAIESFGRILSDNKEGFEDFEDFKNDISDILKRNPDTKDEKIELLNDIKEALKKTYESEMDGLAIIRFVNEDIAVGKFSDLFNVAESMMLKDKICII